MAFAWFSPFVVVPPQSSGGVRVWQVEDRERLFFRKRCGEEPVAARETETISLARARKNCDQRLVGKVFQYFPCARKEKLVEFLRF